MKYVEIKLTDIYQAKFDTTMMSSIKTTTSSISGSTSAEAYTIAPNFINNDTTFEDYDIVVNGSSSSDLPWTPIILPNATLNNYHQLIKHMLTNKGSLQDMSGIFTRINVLEPSGPTGPNYVPKVYYTLSVPDKPSMFKWIFKFS